MRKLSFIVAVCMSLVLLTACSPSKEHLGTDLDLGQYESMTLDILSIDGSSFTGEHPWAYPCTYTVSYELGSDFCVGDRVEVYYTQLVENHNDSEWTAEVSAVFVDFSDFELKPDVAYKPVIYLYPEEKTEVTVTLNYSGVLTHTWPLYDDGWTVIAYPDGTLTDKSGAVKYPYLFWEGEGDTQYDMSRGFCVAGSDTGSFLREKLAYMGLNENEMSEFLDFWLPYMTKNTYNLVSFQTDVYTESAKLTITPEPDSVLRVFMAYAPLDRAVEIEQQKLETFERVGFSVVEWGGSLVLY